MAEVQPEPRLLGPQVLLLASIFGECTRLGDRTHTHTHACTRICAPQQSNNSSEISQCGSVINLLIEQTSECLLCANKPEDRSVDEADVVYGA